MTLVGWFIDWFDISHKVYSFFKPVLYFCRFNFGNLGFWFPWSVVLLVLAAALFTYIALLLVRTVNCSRALQYGFLLMLMLCWCCAGPGRVPSLWRTEALPPLEPQGDERSVSSSFILPSSSRTFVFTSYLCYQRNRFRWFTDCVEPKIKSFIRF